MIMFRGCTSVLWVTVARSETVTGKPTFLFLIWPASVTLALYLLVAWISMKKVKATKTAHGQQWHVANCAGLYSFLLFLIALDCQGLNSFKDCLLKSNGPAQSSIIIIILIIVMIVTKVAIILRLWRRSTKQQTGHQLTQARPLNKVWETRAKVELIFGHLRGSHRCRHHHNHCHQHHHDHHRHCLAREKLMFGLFQDAVQIL